MRQCLTRTWISPQTFDVVLASRSCVSLMLPSYEFSTGTTPNIRDPGLGGMENFPQSSERLHFEAASEIALASFMTVAPFLPLESNAYL